MRTAIVTDSNSGMSQKQAEALHCSVLPMPFSIDGTTYFEDITLSEDEFYQKLLTDAEIFTSQPTPGDVMGLWDRLLETYDDIVYIPMSSGLSSSTSTAIMLSGDYKGKVYVVDNQRISVTQLQAVLHARQLADEGKSAEEIASVLMAEKMDSSIYIMVDTLKYLKKGGRLTPAVAAIGTLLRIKPVLQIQGEKLDTYKQARTLKQAKQIMIQAIQKDIETRFGGNPDDCHISIAHTMNLEAAKEFREELMEVFPGHDHIYIDHLSLSVSCHIGPGALAVTVTKKNGCSWDGTMPFER